MPINDSSWIFVFGSNLAGRHGKGAAQDAVRFYGAQHGVGVGLTGRAYAYPTKDEHLRVLPLDRLREEAVRFMEVARQRPELNFQLTRVGCGLAGKSDELMSGLFADVPMNVHLSGRWRIMLNPDTIPRVIVAGSRVLG